MVTFMGISRETERNEKEEKKRKSIPLLDREILIIEVLS